MSKVYLAGPITGCSYAGCVDWRQGAAEELARHNIIGLSPMRGKADLRGYSEMPKEYAANLMGSSKAIFFRDCFDVSHCDVVLVNLLGAERVSVGTMVEIGLARAAGRPIVLAMEAKGNVHEHPFVSEAASVRVESLEDALRVVVSVLAVHATEPASAGG